ncbi:MAG: trimeric intracellular cation channel family protein [Planctomycetota bacterium]
MPEELTITILVLMYFGDVVFAVSGALTAGRYKMDVIGFVLIGTVTGIGGGTLRDLLLDRTVWWTMHPEELWLCLAASLATFFVVPGDTARRSLMKWSDALGLGAFCVVGCHIALALNVPLVVAVFMGMLTATGGGVIRDVLTNTRPMILGGELYASAALLGALTYGLVAGVEGATEAIAESAGFGVAFGLRALAIIYGIRLGPPGEFLRIGKGEE